MGMVGEGIVFLITSKITDNRSLWHTHTYIAHSNHIAMAKPCGGCIFPPTVHRTIQNVDDTQLYLSFSSNPGEPVAVLNQCLDWMRDNELRLNPDKMEVLLAGGSSV